MKASCSTQESNFNLLSYNLNTLYPLLETTTPLKDQLVPDPNGLYIVRRDNFLYSNMYLITWWRRGIFGESFPEDTLSHNISVTMHLLFQTISQMQITENNFKRHLKDYINTRHFDTQYFADNRAKLKKIYECILPFIKKLRKTNSPATEQLLSYRSPQQTAESSTASTSTLKILPQDPLYSFNKEIEALIKLENIYGDFLPYLPLIRGGFSQPPTNLKLINHLATNVFSKADFKVCYRALNLIKSLIEYETPELSYYFSTLLKLEIPIIQFPDSKADALRRALVSGATVTLSGERSIVLGERLSPVKSGLDGRIIFKINDDNKQVIIFYPNQHYHSMLRFRIRNCETVVVKTVPTIKTDEHHLWSIEKYIAPQTLPLDRFLKLIDFILVNGPRNTIDFSSIVLENPKSLVTLKPIYAQKNDYVTFVETLISYYNAGHYHEECPSLHLFLSLCLKNSHASDKQFFVDLAHAALQLDLHPEEGEKLNVINDGVVNYLMNSKKEGYECRSPKSLREHCTELVNGVLDRREHYLKNNPLDSIQSLNIQIIGQVQAWILPPS